MENSLANTDTVQIIENIRRWSIEGKTTKIERLMQEIHKLTGTVQDKKRARGKIAHYKVNNLLK